MNQNVTTLAATSGGALIVEGFAKVNLSLRVRPRDTSGYHPIRSLVQSIGWADRVTLGFAHDEDGFTVDGDLPAEEDNLAWRGERGSPRCRLASAGVAPSGEENRDCCRSRWGQRRRSQRFGR